MADHFSKYYNSDVIRPLSEEKIFFQAGNKFHVSNKTARVPELALNSSEYYTSL